MRRLASSGAVVTVAVLGCRALIGGLDECTTDGDCTRLGAAGRCVQKLCVLGKPTASTDPDCQTVFGTPGGIEIGAIVTKSTAADAGDLRGTYREDAIHLAVDGLVENGTGGDPIWVRVCDDHSTPDVAAAKASALLEEGAVALLTGGSSATLAIARNGTNGAPIVSYSASRTDIATAGIPADGGPRFLWSLAISDALQGRVLARLVNDGAYARPVSIVNDTQGFQTLHSTINDELQRLSGGGRTLVPYLYKTTADIPPAVARAIADLRPDMVIPIAVVTDTPPILDSWTGPDPVWLFSDNSRNASLWSGLDGGLARVAGSHGTGPLSVLPSSTAYGVFQARYVGRFGLEPGDVSYVPNSYDALLLVAAGVVWAQTHGGPSTLNIAEGLLHLSDLTQPPVQLDPVNFFPIIRKAFEASKNINVQGASGELDLDPVTGFAPGPVEEWYITKDGKFALLRHWTQSADGGLVASDGG
jgi:hypothetical protein